MRLSPSFCDITLLTSRPLHLITAKKAKKLKKILLEQPDYHKSGITHKKAW
jgi:hypothetical protein